MRLAQGKISSMGKEGEELGKNIAINPRKPHLLSSASFGHGPEDRLGLALEKSSSLHDVFSKAAMPRTI